MVDGINRAGGVMPQSGKTVKKQEQAAPKDSTSIFSNKGKTDDHMHSTNVVFEGPVKVTDWVAIGENGDIIRDPNSRSQEITGTEPFPVLEGRIEGTNPLEGIDFGRIGKAALDGAIRAALDKLDE